MRFTITYLFSHHVLNVSSVVRITRASMRDWETTGIFQMSVEAIQGSKIAPKDYKTSATRY